MGSILLAAAPQPSGGACTSGPTGRELQPSARGRLRAAGRYATELDAKHFATNSSKGRLRAAVVPSGTANSRFNIQDLRTRGAACEGRARADLRTRNAGFRGAKLRPADLLRGRYLHKVSPQPSGRACDIKEQPSARGRLRAAAPCGRNSEFKIQDSKLQNWAAGCQGNRIKIFQKVNILIIKYAFLRIHTSSKICHD